jgi:ubiquinone/menaquinone biosynthesis C-methylase UbiE
MREYDLIAEWYPTDRGRTVGVAEALAVAATLPAGSCILDIGCGNGVPITEGLVKAGHRVVGLDTSSGMLARFCVNLPGTPVVRGDVRNCPFRHATFDAAVSWGMMFHLSRADQAAAFASVSRVLKPGASFLFTAAEIEGADDTDITGAMNGVTFHYYAVPSYRDLVGSTASCSSTSTMIPASARTISHAGRGERWRTTAPRLPASAWDYGAPPPPPPSAVAMALKAAAMAVARGGNARATASAISDTSSTYSTKS